MRIFIACVAMTLVSGISQAQVTNDSIQNRILLKLDEGPAYSNTFQSTVQQNCIDKNLTKKCLIYHNDQWFYFVAPDDGRYFLNFAGQECRDKLGIQLILIDGDPCEVKTYKILQCISKLPLRNCYAVLDSMRQGRTYLVNIDGFLGDYCSFSVQFASRAAGFPIQLIRSDTLAARASIREKLVTVEWTTHQEMLEELSGFEVYRNAVDRPRQWIGTVTVNRSNALGVFTATYSIHDTLSAGGMYGYEIFGSKKATGELNLLTVQEVIVPAEVWRPFAGKPHDYQVIVPLDRGKRRTVDLRILDRDSEELLWFDDVQVRRDQTSLNVDLGPYVAAGSMKIRIRILSEPGGLPTEFRYDVNDEGDLVRR